MFKTELVIDGATERPARRWHRALTIPALVVAFAALVLNRSLLVSVLVFPPLVAMPWLICAARNPTMNAVADAHSAVRAVGHILCAFACLLFLWGLTEVVRGSALFAGAAIEAGAALALLLAAGRTARETRVAGSVIVIGLLQAFAALPLAWFGEQYLVLLPSALAMGAGGLWWLIEADHSPAVENHFPVATAL